MMGQQGFPIGGGQLGQMIRDFDWAQTAIGPLGAWPQSLKSVTQMLLLSPVPIVLLWGEDGVMIYNDAYSEFAGSRHPALLGSKVREGWAEISDFNDHVMRVGLSGRTLAYRDQELALQRRGKLEPVWMDLDYSPVLDESGTPAGVIAIVVETTAKVLAQRQLRESERRLRAFVEATSDAIYRMNPDWSQLLHLDGGTFLSDADHAMGDWMEVYVLPEDVPQMQAAIDEAVATRQPLELEHRVRQADGSIGWVASRAVPLTEEDGTLVEWFGAATDITAARRTNEHLRLVINELNHRVKNTLAMVQAIAMRTFRAAPDMAVAQEQFAARLVALAQANDLLTGERWAGASLHSAIEQAVRPHQYDPARCTLSGADLRVSPKTALAMALAMHELSTNAVKYGAWSNESGRVAIAWRIAGEQLLVEWREEGGPIVTPPARRGFGSRLIERGLAGELGGTVTLYFDPGGVRCTIEAPLAAVTVE
ncbi:sensor histidine kinase [Sphingomonas sp. R1]|uniref:sensor histidine kinase n=1 Tax=Sphingomonas sp. R1 TaxID=399176 RepID=UPI0022259C7E|nr:HWE histidine kinase domain-containing protein [Sphingomonas sp. R1]UYY78960.1 PAS domain-containing protein [Sphingomonas sp. R1]